MVHFLKKKKNLLNYLYWFCHLCQRTWCGGGLHLHVQLNGCLVGGSPKHRLEKPALPDANIREEAGELNPLDRAEVQHVLGQHVPQHGQQRGNIWTWWLKKTEWRFNGRSREREKREVKPSNAL